MDMAAAIQAAKDRAAEKSEQPDEHKNVTDSSPTDGSNTDDDGGLANNGVDNAPHTDVSTSNKRCVQLNPWKIQQLLMMLLLQVILN